MTIENPGERNPTYRDLDELRVKIDNLTRGDLIHILNNKVGTLVAVIAEAELEGWNDELRQSYNKEFLEIRALLNKANMEKFGL